MATSSSSKTASKSKRSKKPAAKPVTKVKVTASKSSSSAKKSVKAASTVATVGPKSSREPKVGVFDKLRKWNIGLGILHGVGASAIAALAYDSDAKFPLRVSYLDFNTATQSLETATRTIADVPLVWLVVAFLALSSIFHFIIAGPWFNRYETNLKNGQNPARWVEYSLSASVMIVAIAMLTGVTSLGLLMSLFVITSVMNLLGWVMERVNAGRDKVDWLSFNIGCLAGALPWVVLALYFLSNFLYGSGNAPAFVYVIYFSIFAFFNTFAINMYLQYKKIGNWSDYLYGEKAYMVLSLVAKSALAWQVFGGALGQVASLQVINISSLTIDKIDSRRYNRDK